MLAALPAASHPSTALAGALGAAAAALTAAAGGTRGDAVVDALTALSTSFGDPERRINWAQTLQRKTSDANLAAAQRAPPQLK